MRDMIKDAGSGREAACSYYDSGFSGVDVRFSYGMRWWGKRR